MKLMRKAIAGLVAFTAAVVLSAAGLPLVSSAAANGLVDSNLPQLVATLLPSVVSITTTRYAAIQAPRGQSVMAQTAQPDKSIWFGTGFIVTSDGYVITNKHVVHNGVDFKVTLSDGSQLPASRIAEAVCCDIAVLKINAARPFAPVKLGDSDRLQQGDFVIAIGNPLGFNSTVTTGIISALNRNQGFTPFDDYIQTDAVINQGNSGGPMFNASGEVVGVNSALYTTATSSGNIGIGFAIPINDAKFIVEHMRDIQAGKLKPGYLGAQVQSLTPDLASAYGLPGPWGSIVLKVQDNSPAAQAGLRPGDIITSVGHKFARDSQALLRAVVESVPGTTVLLGIVRGGATQTLTVTLAGLPAGQSLQVFLGEPGVPKPQLPPDALVNFGLELAALTPELRGKYKLGAQQQGVVITGIAIGSTAANANVNAGSVIMQVRDSAVTSPDDVVKVINQERQQKRPYVPLLLAEPSGLRWVSLSLN
jgi:serine protease Do